MRSIKRRIAFHFSIQFITLTVLTLITLLIALFVLVDFLMNEEINKNYPVGALDTISTETWIGKEEVDFPETWEKELKEKKMWLQIVDPTGEVIFSTNTPPSLPQAYSMEDVLTMQEEKQFQGYQLTTLIDSAFYDQAYWYVLGYENVTLNQLNQWVETYASGQQLAHIDTSDLAKELKSMNAFLDVMNENGEIIKRIGSDQTIQRYQPIEIPARISDPTNYDTEIVFKRFPSSTWVLHTPSEDTKMQFSTVQQIMIVLICLGGIILVLLISLTIWHGIRYGQPLLLFISWLERMRNGKYDEVFTDKEKKKLFNKKNKIRLRYKLYKEVIQEFYGMAEQLDLSEKQRMLLDQQREEWMAGISHDLRTPLTTIHGYGYMLESNQFQWSTEELQEIGETIRKKGDYMLDLIHDFSLVSKIKQEGLPTQFQEVNLRTFIEKSTEKYKDHDSITLQLDEGLNLEANGQWIERLLDNLLANAIKHNPPQTAIHILAKKETNSVFLRISDNGDGMDDETQQKMFTRYFRGTNSEEKGAGSGLGMSIAKTIVQAHHGTISVESSLGEGTTITIKLPISQTKLKDDDLRL